MNLQEFLDKYGFGALLDDGSANDLYPNFNTRRENLLGLQLLGAGIPFDGKEFEVVAVEPTQDHALISDQMSPSNEVPSKGMTSKKMGFIRTNERKTFTADDLDEINQAQSLPVGDPKVLAMAQRIISEVNQLTERRDILMERMFWQTVTGAVTLPAQNGQKLQYATDATIATRTGASWGNTTTADPWKDIQKGVDVLDDNGFDVRGLIMTKASYRFLEHNENIHKYLTLEEKSRLQRGERLTTIANAPLVIYNGRWTSSTNGKQFYIPDGKIIFMGSEVDPNVPIVGRFDKANFDATDDAKAPAKTYGEYFGVKTKDDPVGIQYRYSYNGGVGLANGKGVVAMDILA